MQHNNKFEWSLFWYKHVDKILLSLIFYWIFLKGCWFHQVFVSLAPFYPHPLFFCTYNTKSDSSDAKKKKKKKQKQKFKSGQTVAWGVSLKTTRGWRLTGDHLATISFYSGKHMRGKQMKWLNVLNQKIKKVLKKVAPHDHMNICVAYWFPDIYSGQQVGEVLLSYRTKSVSLFDSE